jgi:membrane-bound ClpP family serine protease
MVDTVMEWMTGTGGLIAWLGIIAVIVGVGVLMRHLSVSGRAPEFRQTALIVATSSALLIVAGAGGLYLVHSVA